MGRSLTDIATGGIDRLGGNSTLSDLVLGTKSDVAYGSQPTLSPEQSDMLKKLLATLDPNSAGAQFTGDLTTPQNAVQGASLAAMEQAALNAVAPGNPTDVASKGLTDVMNASPLDIQKAIVNPAMETFNQQILPDISRRFSGMSGFGSDRIMQEGIAGGNAATGIAAAVADAQQKQQALKIQAATGLASVNSTNVGNLTALSGAGNAAMTAANTPSAAYQAFLNQQALKQNNMANILAALGIKTLDNSAVVTPGQPGLLQGFVQGAGAGLGKAAAGML